MNKVLLIGRLTKDIEVKQTSNQQSYAQFAVAVDRRYKSDNGERQADFINCVAWRKTAEFLGQYFHKGDKIGIEGQINTRTYDDKNGQKQFVTEVLVEQVEFVESKKQTVAQTAPTAPTMSVEKAAEILNKNSEIDEDAVLPFEI